MLFSRQYSNIYICIAFWKFWALLTDYLASRYSLSNLHQYKHVLQSLFNQFVKLHVD